MFQLLNSHNAVLKMVRIHCNNLRITPRDSAQLGFGNELSMKSDYGIKLELILVDMSLQAGYNVLNIDSVFGEVVDFFDSFTSSDSWLEQIDINIKDELNKQNKKAKAV